MISYVKQKNMKAMFIMVIKDIKKKV